MPLQRVSYLPCTSLSVEYYFKVLRTICCGSRYTACYAFGTWIFCFCVYRNLAVDWAIQAQSHAPLLPASAHQLLSSLLPPSLAVSADALHSLLGGLVLACGSVLVVSSMWKLGFTGTYLGDYCGIYMDAMVQGFPFNTMRNPMYNGTTLCFLGHAIMCVRVHAWTRTMPGLYLNSFQQRFRFISPPLAFLNPRCADDPNVCCLCFKSRRAQSPAGVALAAVVLFRRLR
jgi:hypothetical protein